MATLSRFTSVRLLRVPEVDVVLTAGLLGKKCDCKSLHWKFSDKRSCDGRDLTPVLPATSALTRLNVQIVATVRCSMYDHRLTTSYL